MTQLTDKFIEIFLIYKFNLKVIYLRVYTINDYHSETLLLIATTVGPRISNSPICNILSSLNKYR